MYDFYMGVAQEMCMSNACIPKALELIIPRAIVYMLYHLSREFVSVRS